LIWSIIMSYLFCGEMIWISFNFEDIKVIQVTIDLLAIMGLWLDVFVLYALSFD
jgi:hypothetical protein